MRILLLVGPRGAGKTTACQRFLRRAGALGWRLGGILAPGRFGDDGGKTGMDIEDVAMAPVLDALGMASARAALLVVREELGAELAARLDHLSPRTVRLDATARDAVPDLLVDALCGSSGVPCGE